MAGEAKTKEVVDVELDKQVDELTTKTAASIARKATKSIGEQLLKAVDGGTAEKAEKTPVTFEASTGKWIVNSPLLAKPVSVASKERAMTLFKAISATRDPEIRLEAGKFLISHADWKEPVLAASAEEAAEIAVDKLISEGLPQSDAESKAQELVETAQGVTAPVVAAVSVIACVEDMKKALKAMQQDPGLTEHAAKMEALISEVETATSNKPKAEGDQVMPEIAASDQKAPAGPKDQVIAGPKTEGIKQGAPGTNPLPTVPGYVTTEKPAKSVLPSDGKGGGLKQEQTSSDYEGKAKAHDNLVEQLKSKKGLMNKVAASIDKHGAEKVEAALKSLLEDSK